MCRLDETLQVVVGELSRMWEIPVADGRFLLVLAGEACPTARPEWRLFMVGSPDPRYDPVESLAIDSGPQAETAEGGMFLLAV